MTPLLLSRLTVFYAVFRSRRTCDPLLAVAEATIWELSNHGSGVIDRVAAGEHITITRAGRPVAELRPLPTRRVTAAALIDRLKRVPPVDVARFRADVDAAADQCL